MSVNPNWANPKQFHTGTLEPVTLGRGTRYAGITAQDLLDYTTAVFNLKLYSSKSESTRQLTNFLVHSWPSNEVKSALHRMIAVIQPWDFGPDTLVKIVSDMDTAFFNGLLRHKVQVSWEDKSSMKSLPVPDPTFENCLASTSFDEVNHIAYIRLNREKICFGGHYALQALMLEALGHEMVHAWSFLYCPIELNPDPLDSYEGWEPGHGWHFRWILNLLDERTNAELGFRVISDLGDYRIADMEHERRRLPFLQEPAIASANILSAYTVHKS